MAQIHPGPPLYQLVSDGGHDVRAAFGSVKAVVRVQIPLASPLSKSGTRKTAIRAVRIGETLGAAPRRATISFAPVAEQTTGIRLLNGTTQVQVLPGAIPLNAQSVRPAC